MSRLVNDLLRNGYLKTDLIIDAFSEVSRVEFVPDHLVNVAEADMPLPIGSGQTISQPMTVAFMLELLSPQRGQNILDIGSGSGWTTALLAFIVGATGHVTGLERILGIYEMGKRNLEKYPFIARDHIVSMVHADGYNGYADKAPYDRILVSAAVDEVPQTFKDQLKPGGSIVLPVHNSIWYLEKGKGSSSEFVKEEYPGFSFVPFMHRE